MVMMVKINVYKQTSEPHCRKRKAMETDDNAVSSKQQQNGCSNDIGLKKREHVAVVYFLLAH